MEIDSDHDVSMQDTGGAEAEEEPLKDSMDVDSPSKSQENSEAEDAAELSDQDEDQSDEPQDSGPDELCGDYFLWPMHIKKREAMRKIIQDDWNEVIMKARKGDLQALQALSAFTEEIPDGEISGFCEVLCFHLRKPIPAVTQKDEPLGHVEQLAIVSVHGLGSLLDIFSGGDLENTVYVSWKAIARWIFHLYIKFLGGREPPSSAEMMIRSVALLLAKSASNPRVKELVCSDPKFLKVIAVLWSMDSFYCRPDKWGDLSHAIDECGRYSEDARQTLVTLVIRENFGVTDCVAMKLTERIARYLHRTITPFDFYALDAFAGCMLRFSVTPPVSAYQLHMQLNLNEGIYEINQLLSQKLVAAIPPPDDVINHKAACSAISKFITFFKRTFERFWGNVFVNSALKFGFLKSLIDFSPHLDQEPLHSFCSTVESTLTKTLTRHLMCYTLLDSFTETFRRDYTEEARQKIETTPVAEAWKLYEGFLLERAGYKFFFDDNQDREDISLRCGNTDCEEFDETHKFKICSVCKSERYCTKECQLIAWKFGGHKQKCKKKTEHELKNEKDDAFILYCIRRDVLRRLPGLDALAERQWKNVRFSTCGISIDYTTLPPRFEVFLLQSLLDEVTGFDTALEKRLNRLLQPYEKGKKRAMLVRAIIPNEDRDEEVHSKTIYVELSYGPEKKDPFALPDDEKPSVEYKWKRHNSLEVAVFDKVDQYLINEHLRLTSLAKDSKSSEDRLKEDIAAAKGKGRVHVRTVTPLPKYY